MKKKLPLYILLLFLIIMNGFFLYNYLGTDEGKEAQKGPKRPGNFLVKELGFDELQQEQFRALGKRHHQQMRGFDSDIRDLKDELFKGLSDDALKDVNVDSIAKLIGEKEAAKDIEVFKHFNSVQELCNDKQKEKFSKIIKDALRKGGRNQGLPRGGRPDGNRPNRPIGPRGDRPPPERY